MLLKFFIYSVAGCMLEGVWCVIKTGSFRSRRMLLNLPMCPVYGVGGVLLSLMLSAFRNNLILLCVLGALVASCVELLFFAVGRLFFSVKLWDYSDKPYSLFDGICGEYTAWWGVVSVIFVRYIDTGVTMLLSSVPPYTKLIITVFLSVVTLADIMKTVRVLKSFRIGVIDELPECFWYMKRIS